MVLIRKEGSDQAGEGAGLIKFIHPQESIPDQKSSRGHQMRDWTHGWLVEGQTGSRGREGVGIDEKVNYRVCYVSPPLIAGISISYQHYVMTLFTTHSLQELLSVFGSNMSVNWRTHGEK